MDQKSQIEKLKAKKENGSIKSIVLGSKFKSIKMEDVKKLDKDKILSGQFEIGQESPEEIVEKNEEEF